MTKYIPLDALVAEIERRIEHNTEWKNACKTLAVIAVNQAIEEDKKILSIIDTLEVKEADFCTINENLMEAYEYLDFTHTSNLAHNKPMVATRLKKAIQELYNAGLLKLTHDEKYRMENLGLKAQKGEKV